MTWSVIAHDPRSGAFGVAIATRAFAVGARTIHMRPGLGAVATQSMTNPYLGTAVLDALARGLAPRSAIESALAGDTGAGIRQVHAVDAKGRVAAWTGANCVIWAGHMNADGVSVAGNMLVGAGVIETSMRTYVARVDLPLPERLVASLQAGETAGGDKRGRQSAALAVQTTEDYRDIDLRVDDHRDPLTELARLLGVWRQTVEPRRAWTPTRANPSGVTDLDAIERVWSAAGQDLKFRR